MQENNATANRDRDLLLGILAVQIRVVTAEELVQALKAWVGAPGESFVNHLTAVTNLSESDCRLLTSLVDATIARYGGDATLSLAAFDGEREVSRILVHTNVQGGEGEGVDVGRITTTLGLPRDFVETQLEELAAVEEAPGRYSRSNEYSRGGMGRIMLVHDEYIGRDIALKELLPPDSERDTMLGEVSPMHEASAVLRRFLHEARLTGQLEHPSIVPVYELGRNPSGGYYYTMKLVRGKTLSQALKGGATLEERLRFLPHFMDLCHAIAYAHSRGVIHRDIKPANVMVGSFGETVVIDWGLAKIKGKDDPLRKTASADGAFHEMGGTKGRRSTASAEGVPVGTPVYMPPEQAEGRIDDIDERSDVYSLGAVLYVLLTGTSPFTGGSAQEVIERVIHEEPVPVCTVESRVPAELAGICHKALKKDPAARYQSAQELAEEIERYQSGALVHSYDYGLGEMLWRFYSAHKTILQTAGACLLFLACLGVYSYTRVYQARERERNQRIAAEQAQEVAVEARDEERAARELAEHETYVSQIRLAQALVDGDNLEVGRETLWKTQQTRRHWEWGYLLNRAYPEVVDISNSRWAVYSHDGSRIATISKQLIPTVRDAETGKPIAQFPDGTCRSVAFSPSGDRLVGACETGNAAIWSIEPPKRLVTLKGHSGPITWNEFSPDGSKVVTSSEDQTAKIWDAGTGEELATFSGVTGSVWYAAFSPDAAHIVTTSEPEIACVWDVQTRSKEFEMRGRWPKFNSDGTLLLTTDGKTVFVWDAQSGAQQASFEHGEGQVLDVCFCPAQARILTASSDSLVRLWDITTKEVIRTYEHAGPVQNIACSPDGNLLATFSGKGILKVWCTATGASMKEVRAHSVQANSLSFRGDSQRVLTASLDDSAKVWEAQRSPAMPSVLFHDAPVNTVAVSMDGRYLATASEDMTARVFASGGNALTFACAAYSPYGCFNVALDPTGQRIVMVPDQFTCLLLDVNTGSLEASFSGHAGPVEAVAFSPDGKRIVSSSWDQTARIWEAAAGKELACLSGHLDSVLDASFSPDGSRLVTASRDTTSRIWDAQTGASLVLLQGHKGEVCSAEFSPDGKRIVSASADNTARVWDAATGEVVFVLSGHSKKLFRAVFSPDGTRILTSSGDATARVWDANSGDAIGTLGGPQAKIYDVRFLADGRRIVTAGGDRRAGVLEAAPWRAELLPGADSMSWPERYMLQRTQFQVEPTAPTNAPLPLIVVTTEDTALERLGRLKRALEEESVPQGVGEGIVLAAGPRHSAVARLCLLEGDVIVSMDGTPTPDSHALIGAIDSYLSQKPNQQTPLSMDIVRLERPISVRFLFYKPVSTERKFTFSREEALGLLQFEQQMLEENSKITVETSKRYAAKQGDSAEGPTALNGMWVLGEGSDLLKKAFYLRLGLAMWDRMVQFDGAPVNDLAELKEQYKRIVEHLERGDAYSLTVEVERGEFQRIRTTLDVK